MGQEETQMVSRCQQGDQEALKEIFDKYHKKVYRIAYGVVRQREEIIIPPERGDWQSDEVVAGAKLLAISRVPLLRSGENFGFLAKAILKSGFLRVHFPLDDFAKFIVSFGSLGKEQGCRKI